MASSTDVANLALSHLQVGKEIQNLETDQSAEARACRRFYNSLRDKVFRDRNWPFARRFLTLVQVAANPTTEWGFSYRYPTDCAAFRRILSGTRNDTHGSRVPYILGSDSEGTLIFTDQPTAQGEYTALIDDEDFWPPDFVLAFSLLLAGYVAPRVTGGDPFKLSDRCFKLYDTEMSRALTNAFNEMQPDRLPDPELIRARDGSFGNHGFWDGGID